MSVQVAVADLPATIARYDLAFLVTVSAAGQPRFLAQRPRVEPGPVLVVAVAGEATRKRATAGEIALLYPPVGEQEHALIVDGVAQVRGEDIVITPTGAVLHVPR